MKIKKSLFLTQAAMIAAFYVVLTIVFQAISFGQVQVRIAEALTILPAFTPAAIPGLFIGCLISNMIGSAALWDILFGSLATLLGAVFTYLFRKKKAFLIVLPPIISNSLIIPLILRYTYGINLPLYFLIGSIAIGEVLSCGVLGMILFAALQKNKHKIFGLNM